MKKLLCKINGHQFRSIKKQSTHIKEYQCSCCNQKFTTDGYGQIIKLTKYWEENNRLFERHFSKKAAV